GTGLTTIAWALTNAGLPGLGYALWVQLLPSSSPHTDDYTYDARGNLIADPTRRYEYDAFNRLLRVTDGAAAAKGTTFHYDAFGRRLVKDSIRFVFHGDRVIEEIDAQTAWHKRYVYGAEGLLALEIDDLSALRRFFVHEDRA